MLTAVETKEVNADWYLARYPQAAQEVASGEYETAQQHYESVGIERGYRPFARGPRFITNPDRYHLDLWTDEPNAKEQLTNKLTAGEISNTLAPHIENFIDNGFVILKGPIANDQIDAARSEIEDAYNGRRNDVKFDWKAGSHWEPEIISHPAKAFDLHYLSDSVRNVVLADSVVDVLNAIFSGPVIASQTLSFYRGSQQALHQDTAYVTYSQPKFFVGVWTALEDVTEGAGELLYVPGSHKLKPWLFADKYYSVHEALTALPDLDRQAATQDYLADLYKRCTSDGHAIQHFLPEKGDVLIWHPLLAHGGARISEKRSRKSVVTHFCPRWAAPHYFEHQKRPLIDKNENVSYSTFAY